MAEQGRADAPDRFAHGTGSTEKKEAERDDFRPGVTGGTSETLPDTGRATARGADRDEGTEVAGPQSIEATTAALGDMEPSAGSGGRGASSAAESANDDTST